MKRIALLFTLIISLVSSIPAIAQWSWEGQIYFGLNQNLFLPVTFNGDVEVTVADGFTVRAPGAVKGNGYTMSKKGGGCFWFQADNPNFDSNIVYVGKSDTVRLDGIFGQFINDSIGYSYTGSLISSADSISFFHLHQNDTVVQTFDASGYVNTNTNLYIYSDTRSALRIIKSSDKLAGRVIISDSGTLYIDGTYNAEIFVKGGKLITGENSVAGHRDYAAFANTFNDSTITVNAATMQTGTWTGPSLVYVKSGNVIQENGAVLKIDVYNPSTNWNLTSGIHSDWINSFSDRIYMEGKDYIFKTSSKIDVSWDTAYISSIAGDTVFYLPVIMLNNSSVQQITGKNDVTVNQTLPGWRINFIIGDGNNGTQSGWGYIRGKRIQWPDNVSDADCFIDPPATAWGIREVLPINTTDRVHNFGSLTVGNIYGNDTVAIIGFMDNDNSTGDLESHGYPCHGIKIFYFDKTDQQIKLKNSFTFPAAPTGSPVSTFSAMAIARYNNTGYIVVAGNDRYLYAYSPDGALIWKSDSPYSSNTNYFATIVSIADFNHDGIPEVYTGNRIFSLATGEMLCAGTGNTGALRHDEGDASIAADIVHDNENNLELCAGTQIYRVDIPQGATTNSAGTISLISDMELLGQVQSDFQDGATQVVDIDNDGELEVVFITAYTAVYPGIPAQVYAWKPLSGNGSYLIGSYTTPIASGYYGIPMIGNIDGDIYPEIVYLGDKDHIYALDYVPANAGGPRFERKWTYTTSGDVSSCTGMTLFDFNNDGKSEIIYRDETHLHIIEGSGSAPVVEASFANVYSYTLREFPVIADIDDDGQAEIVVSGHTAGLRYNGYVRVFKSDGSQWAPARKVWNQYMYNAVNVNEDLTIPQYQLNPATSFPGADGKFAPPPSYDDDNVRPYNNFRKQQTFLSKNGTSLWLAPHPKADSTFYHYDAVKDSMSVTVDVVNTGNVPFSAPFYITVYKDTVGNATKYTYDYSDQIKNGDTVRITFSILNYLSSWGDAPRLYIRLNDSGNSFSDQLVCDSLNNDRDASNSSLLLAINDFYNTFVNNILVFNPKVNDIISQPSITTFDVDLPKRGTRPSPQDADSVHYTPPLNEFGVDTIYYTLTQQSGKFTSTSTAVINVYIADPPDNISDADCYITPPSGNFDIKRDMVSSKEVYWLATPFVGDLDRDGHLEVVVPGKESSKIHHTTDTSSTASTILIFNDMLELEDSIDVKALTGKVMPEYNTMTFLIADVDNNGYGEIVVCTDDRYLHCFSWNGTNGTEKWVSDQPYGDGNTAGYCPSLVIADIDRDGYSEILAADKIFAGESGKALVTLPSGGRGFSEGSPKSYMPVFADVDNNGIQEVVAGNTVYKVTINDRNNPSLNTATVLKTAPNSLPDGFTSVADIDLDGDLDVIVTGGGSGTNEAIMYVWDGATSTQIGNTISIDNGVTNGKTISRAFAGDIDGDKRPDIAFTSAYRIQAYGYDPNTNPPTGAFNRHWQRTTTDKSGATTMSMFDFNQDGDVELVYRDQDSLRIIDKYGNNKATIPCASETHTEYPVIVDLDKGGHADILVSGHVDGFSGIRIIRYVSGDNGIAWAPARPVWNQHAYNSANITDTLGVPQYPLNPATEFPGPDGLTAPPNDADNVRPYNAFLQQQTVINTNGIPVWLTPDVVFDPAETHAVRDGDSVAIHVCITNQGAAPIGKPVYFSLYRDDVDYPAKYLATDSIDVLLLPGADTCLTVGIHDVTKIPPFVQIVVRLNDRNGDYPYQPECATCCDSIQTGINPALDLMMHKDATLNGVQDNGTYPNPVSVLFSENIKYEITAVNANLTVGNVIIRDTLPPYLKYATGSVTGGIASTGATTGTPSCDTIRWVISSVDPLDTVRVSFEATPESGASASQPLYINRAYVQVSDTLFVATNRTYHQGAGVSVVTFSASTGGHIFNSGEQALDYRTCPRAGVLIVPDSGYAFAGWSHDKYVSLRGEVIPADSGIMDYADLVIYGNVKLRADFAPVEDAPEEKEITEDSVINTNDKVWSSGKDLYIRTKKGKTARIYTSDGVLHRQFIVTVDGLTTVRLERAVYIVTLNDGVGYKVVISY